jgi:hypothetical protein
MFKLENDELFDNFADSIQGVNVAENTMDRGGATTLNDSHRGIAALASEDRRPVFSPQISAPKFPMPNAVLRSASFPRSWIEQKRVFRIVSLLQDDAQNP